MSDAALGWLVIVGLVSVPLVMTAVASTLRKRGIWNTGKDGDRRRGGGGGGSGSGCGGGAGCGGGCGGG